MFHRLVKPKRLEKPCWTLKCLILYRTLLLDWLLRLPEGGKEPQLANEIKQV